MRRCRQKKQQLRTHQLSRIVRYLTETAEVFNLTETPTAPTPAAQTPLRTDFDMLKEIFEQFPTAKEARRHIAEVATGHNKFNRTFGESSIRKVIAKKCNFRGDPQRIESREATAHIGAGTEMEIPQEATATAEPEQVNEQPERTLYPSGEVTPTPSMQFGAYDDVKAELAPIQERSVKGILDNVLSIAGLKGDGTGDGTEFLTAQESRDTVTLIPYILKKAMKTEMTQENYENLTLGLYAANLTSKVVKRRIEKGKLLKPENPAVAQEIPAVGVKQPEAPAEPASEIAAVNEPALPIDEQKKQFGARFQ